MYLKDKKISFTKVNLKILAWNSIHNANSFGCDTIQYRFYFFIMLLSIFINKFSILRFLIFQLKYIIRMMKKNIFIVSDIKELNQQKQHF